MINLQNPTLPVIANPIEIDRAIVDLQAKFLLHLSDWLTHGYGRAYKNLNVDSEKRVFVPEVFLGQQLDTQRYTIVTPDNDKEGQNFFLVKEEKQTDYKQGRYNYLSYEVAIIFSVNLETVNSVLLETYHFQQELVSRVRDVITRKAVGVPYTTEIKSVQYVFDDVFREFQIDNQTQIEKSELTHFRVNTIISLKEECGALPLDLCTAILALLNANPSLEACVSASICAPTPFPNDTSTLFDGVNEAVISSYNAAHELERTDLFSMDCWFKIPSFGSLKAVINKFDHNGVRRGYYLYVHAGGLRFGLSSDESMNNRLYVQTLTTLNVDTWYHGCITYTGNSLPSGVTFYIDGVPLATNKIVDNLSGTTVDPTNILRFGEGITSTNFLGNLWNGHIWKGVVLTPAEVLTMATTPVPITPPQSGFLVANNRFGGDSVFGSSVRIYPDDSGTVTGYQSVNMEFADVVIDTPP